jgi:hypothetical protein
MVVAVRLCLGCGTHDEVLSIGSEGRQGGARHTLWAAEEPHLLLYVQLVAKDFLPTVNHMVACIQAVRLCVGCAYNMPGMRAHV